MVRMWQESRKLFLDKKSKLEIYEELITKYDKKVIAKHIGYYPETKRYFGNKNFFIANSVLFSIFFISYFIFCKPNSQLLKTSDFLFGSFHLITTSFLLYRGNFWGFLFSIIILALSILDGFRLYYNLLETRFLSFGLIGLILLILNLIFFSRYHRFKDFFKDYWDDRNDIPLF